VHDLETVALAGEVLAKAIGGAPAQP
jgi:hypothetical protein